MTWTKLSDDFLNDAELQGVGRSARLLLVELYLWSNRFNTDGAVPTRLLGRATDSRNRAAELRELVDAGLIEKTSDGYQLDWQDQQSAGEVAAQRAVTAARQARFRMRKNLHANGDHSICDRKKCPESRRDVTRDVTANETEPRPVPSVLSRRDRGQTTGTAADAPLPVSQHAFVDDGSGISCNRCDMHIDHPVHQED